jgi:hypothetical protein
MQKRFLAIIVSLLFLLAAGAFVSAARPIGGDQGWYEVQCNVDGATVFFNGQNVGTIQAGYLYVPVYTTGTPYTSYTVSMPGYTTASGPITSVPGKGEFVTIVATLNPVAPTTPAGPIGGDIGWYVVHCNVNGATVFFDSTNEGQINQGTLTVQVYVTGTPFKTYSVQMNGYTPFTAAIDQYPAKGQTVDLYATLNPLPPTQTLPPPTTKSPVPVEICILASLVAGAGIVLLGRTRS